MKRTEMPCLDALSGISARPCASTHGSAWLAEQGFDVSTAMGNTTAHRLPGAPT